MIASRLTDRARSFVPAASVALILLLAGAALARHLGDDPAETGTALARYQRIAADLPRLEAAVRSRPVTAPTERTSDNPSIAAAQWQSRLSRLAAAKGLQLASAEALLGDRNGGKPAIALELVGTNAGLLSFLYEIERGAAPMSVARLEISPTSQLGAGTTAALEPQLRIRLQAVPPSTAPSTAP